MTAMSSGRTAQGARQAKGPHERRALTAARAGVNGSDREGRPAAAAAGRVRVLEREAGFLEVALEVDDGAVQVLRAELVDEQPHAGALDDDVVAGGLRLDVEAVAEPRAAARQHR